MAISRNKPNPAIEELLQTQEQFHKAMRRLVNVYATVLPTLSSADQAQLTKFLLPYSKLQNNPFSNFKRDVPLEEQVRQVDDIIRSQVRPLEPAYESCARHYNHFLKFLNDKNIKLLADDGAGKQFDAGQQIIKPTQNLMRYKMLIETAMKPGNLGYQGRDESYRNDPSFQQLANLASMLEGDVKMINRRAQATPDLKATSAMSFKEMTSAAKQARLQHVVKKRPAKTRAPLHGLFKPQEQEKEEPASEPKNKRPKNR